MSHILCIYCTRTGHTETLMQTISRKVGAELVEITDGKDRSGFWGYVSAAVAGLRKNPPAIREVQTAKPLEEYDQVIVGMPIWSENTCPIARGFLQQYGSRIRGDVSYVVTHASDRPYDEAIARLDDYLGKSHRWHLSVSSKKDDMSREIDGFTAKIEDRKESR